MATDIFYPDAHPETTSVDGYIYHMDVGGLTWAALRAAAGTNSASSTGGVLDAIVSIRCDGNANRYDVIQRSLFLVDISALQDDAPIISVTFSLYGTNTGGYSGIEPSVNIYSSNPASNTELEAGDFDSIGSAPYCDTPIARDDWDKTGYNDFLFNTAGLAALASAMAGNGILKLGARDSVYDVGGATPPWSDPGGRTIYAAFADKGGGYKPKLTIIYVSTPAVTTDDATVLGRTTYADLNGTLDDDGDEACDCGFEWGTTIAYGNTTSTQSKETGESFSKTITGLSSNTTYHFRAIATNTAGTGYGEDKTFTTTISGELKSSTLRLLSYDCRGIWYPARRNIIQCTVLCGDDLLLKDGSIDTQTGATIKAAIEEARDDATWPITFYDIDGSTVYVKVLSARYRMADVTKERNKEHVWDLILLKVPLE